MFKVMLKGTEFAAKVNTEKSLVLMPMTKPTLEYVLNKDEVRLEQKLEDGRKVVISLMVEDVNKLEEARMKVITLIKHSVELMKTKKDAVIVVKSDDTFVALPESVYDNTQLSEKFLEGFLYVVNNQVSQNLSYDELQYKLNDSPLRFELKDGKEENGMTIYRIDYDKMLEYLV